MLELMKYPNIHIFLKFQSIYWIIFTVIGYSMGFNVVMKCPFCFKYFSLIFFLGPEAQHCVCLLQGPTVPLESLLWCIMSNQKPIVLIWFEIKSVWKASHLWSFQSLYSSFFTLIWTCVFVSSTCTKSLKDMDWLLLMFVCLVVGAQ